jgi:SAM-dependent methyltransferase
MTELYENLATLYDVAGWGDFAQGMAERVLALAADHGLSEIHHIVDVACGTGIAAAQFAQAGYRVTGVDRSPHMLAQARRRVAEAGLQPKVTFVEADMRDFAFDQARDGLRIVGLAEDGARFYVRSQTAAAARLGHDFVPVQKMSGWIRQSGADRHRLGADRPPQAGTSPEEGRRVSRPPLGRSRLRGLDQDGRGSREIGGDELRMS